MNRFLKFWERFFPPIQPLPAGVYHYQAPADAPLPYRLHLRLEPDGSVLPCQSYYQPLGSLLIDPWEKIWNHELAVSLRERRNLPIDCQACALLVECGGGCPLARQANPAIRPHAIYADLPGLSKKASADPLG